MVPKSHHIATLSPESIGGGVRGAMPLEYLEEDYEAGVDALPQQLRFCIKNLFSKARPKYNVKIMLQQQYQQLQSLQTRSHFCTEELLF